eukprot:gene9078-13562_t
MDWAAARVTAADAAAIAAAADDVGEERIVDLCVGVLLDDPAVGLAPADAERLPESVAARVLSSSLLRVADERA